MRSSTCGNKEQLRGNEEKGDCLLYTSFPVFLATKSISSRNCDLHLSVYRNQQLNSTVLTLFTVGFIFWGFFSDFCVTALPLCTVCFFFFFSCWIPQSGVLLSSPAVLWDTQLRKWRDYFPLNGRDQWKLQIVLLVAEKGKSQSLCWKYPLWGGNELSYWLSSH